MFSTHLDTAIFVKFEIVVCKFFQYGRVSKLPFGKGLRSECTQHVARFFICTLCLDGHSLTINYLVALRVYISSYFCFKVDGFLFYKKDGKYKKGETDEVLWLKPYMLPEVFDNIGVPRRYMEQIPNTYTDFATFVEEVVGGKHAAKKKDKKKKKKKEFVPDVVLQLPENPQAPGETRANKKKNKKPAQVSYYGPDIGFKGRGIGRGQASGRGGHAGGPVLGRQNYVSQRDIAPTQYDSYGRLLASSTGDNQANARFYGQGKVSGYSYFGDERDIYYPDYQPPHGDSRRIRGQTNPNSFGMGDMEAALAYYGYDSPQKQPPKRTYKMF